MSGRSWRSNSREGQPAIRRCLGCRRSRRELPRRSSAALTSEAWRKEKSESRSLRVLRLEAVRRPPRGGWRRDSGAADTPARAGQYDVPDDDTRSPSKLLKNSDFTRVGRRRTFDGG